MPSPAPIAAVIGDPIGHSLSPRLFRFWLDRMGLGGYYVPFAVTPDALPEALAQMRGLGIRGTNVTLPHKEAVLGLAHKISDRARAIGAANTLTFGPDGVIEADNTDGVGFLANLRQAQPGWQPADGPALVIGAGGAARAILWALIDAGCPQVLLINRTEARASALAAALGGPITVLPWDQAEHALARATTVVNTSSLGMAGQPDLQLPFEALNPAALVTDIVYTPLCTGLLQAARAKGCATVDGLGMLLHQAVPGFERWFGARPEVDDATRAHILQALA